jgi:type I restriction enzyme S subunit
MFDWPTVTLKEAGVILIDCDHKTPKAQEEGFPYVGIPQLKEGRIKLDGARLINEVDFHHWRRKAKPTPNDVILSRRCNPGETAYVPEDLDIALGQNLVLLRSDGKKLYPPFLRWVVHGSNWWNQISKFINVGAVFDSLKCVDIPKFEIKLPPMESQIKISEILGILDNKIELNHQTNQILEQIAQAIFKSWFVDFEPVKAKIQAKRTLTPTLSKRERELIVERAAMCAISGKSLEELGQLSPETQQQLKTTAALFPDALVESELGGVPEGWEVKTFGDVSQCFDSKRIPLSKKKREEKKPGNIPYYGATSRMDYINEWIFDDIHLLLGEDGSVINDDGTPFIQYIWGKAWVNNHAHVLQGKNGVSTEQLMLFIQSQNIAAYITGAVQLKLNQGNMNSIPFLDSGESLNKMFYNFIEPSYRIIRLLIEENQSLTELRDTLLPKLLSGELTLSSAAINEKIEKEAIGLSNA